jgi:hypothetical protein
VTGEQGSCPELILIVTFPTAEQTSNTGDNPARLWNNVVVPGTFSPRDKCVRGHIPITLNVDLGQKAYQGLINSDRLIDQDPFWVAVTS